jgi:hypothetical protein
MTQFTGMCPCGNQLEKAHHPFPARRRRYFWNCFRCFPYLERYTDANNATYERREEVNR